MREEHAGRRDRAGSLHFHDTQWDLACTSRGMPGISTTGVEKRSHQHRGNGKSEFVTPPRHRRLGSRHGQRCTEHTTARPSSATSPPTRTRSTWCSRQTTQARRSSRARPTTRSQARASQSAAPARRRTSCREAPSAETRHQKPADPQTHNTDSLATRARCARYASGIRCAHGDKADDETRRQKQAHYHRTTHQRQQQPAPPC